MNLKELLAESFALADNQYTDEQSILSLKNFDSMNHMIFITELEKTFNVELTGDEIMTMTTIGDIKRILQQKGISV